MTIAELTRALRAHWLSMSITGSATFIAVVAFVLLVPPRYRSEALLRIEAKRSDAGLLGSLDEISGMSALGLGRDEVETEIGVLSSRRMQDAAIDSLGLEAVVVTPKSGHAGILAARATGESTLSGTLQLTRTSATAWSIKADWSGDSVKLPDAITTGKLRVGPLDLTVLAPDSIKTIKLRLLPRYRVREQFDGRLTIRRRSPGAKLVEVRYEDRDRLMTPRVVSVLVGSYLDYARHIERGDAGKTIGELRHATDSVEQALRSADERLRDYQLKNQAFAPAELATLQLRRITALRSQLDEVELERDALVQLLGVVDERSKGGRDATAYRQLATFPSLITNKGIQDLLGALTSLETERAKLGVRRTENNADLRALSDRIEAVELDLRRVGTQYREALDQQFTERSKSLTRLTDDMNSFPSTEMRYVRLVRDRTLLGETWAALLKQLKVAELQDASRLEKVRLVDAPSTPQINEKVFPRPLVHTALGAVLALLVAFATGLAGVLWSARAEPVVKPATE